MNRYQIIFSDIDGTLLNSHHHVSSHTQTILRRLSENGIPFVPVSARSPEGIRSVLSEMGIEAPMIAYGGALLLNPGGQPLRGLGIPTGEARHLLTLAAENYPDVSRSLYAGNSWFTGTPDDPWIRQEMEITGTTPLYADSLNCVTKGRAIHKLMCMGEPARIDGLNDLLRGKFPELGIQKSKPTYLEITVRQASKASGVEMFCADQGISTQNAIAFGDNLNDLDMLETVGLGIAMGNAPKEVQMRSHRVTRSNDEDGIYHALADIFPEYA